MEIDPSPRSSLIGFVEGTQLDATAITFVDLAPSLSLSLSPSLPSFLSQSLYQSQELPPTRYSYRLNGFLSLYLSLSLLFLFLLLSFSFLCFVRVAIQYLFTHAPIVKTASLGL